MSIIQMLLLIKHHVLRPALNKLKHTCLEVTCNKQGECSKRGNSWKPRWRSWCFWNPWIQQDAVEYSGECPASTCSTIPLPDRRSSRSHLKKNNRMMSLTRLFLNFGYLSTVMMQQIQSNGGQRFSWDACWSEGSCNLFSSIPTRDYHISKAISLNETHIPPSRTFPPSSIRRQWCYQRPIPSILNQQPPQFSRGLCNVRQIIAFHWPEVPFILISSESSKYLLSFSDNWPSSDKTYALNHRVINLWLPLQYTVTNIFNIFKTD